MEPANQTSDPLINSLQKITRNLEKVKKIDEKSSLGGRVYSKIANSVNDFVNLITKGNWIVTRSIIKLDKIVCKVNEKIKGLEKSDSLGKGRNFRKIEGDLNKIGKLITILYDGKVTTKSDSKKLEDLVKNFNETKKLNAKAMSKDPIYSTPIIKKNFTTDHTIKQQRDAHEGAKEYLTAELERIGGELSFARPSKKSAPILKSVTLPKTASDLDALDPGTFKFQYTTGVLGDIKKDGNRLSDDVVVYGVASQFNGCEARDSNMIEPGEAVKKYKGDLTQGPQAQLAFPDEQVELINCAGHRGFNALCRALDEQTRAEIVNGYFTPSEENADAVIKQLRTNGNEIEYPCIGNIPKGGVGVVHQIFVSAPALGGMYEKPNTVKGEKREEIEFLCALQGYRAQFDECIWLAKAEDKAVIFKPAAIGLGAYGNDPDIVAKGFYQAAKEYQEQLKENKVQVIFQVFKSDKGANPEAQSCVNALHLTELGQLPQL